MILLQVAGRTNLRHTFIWNASLLRTALEEKYANQKAAKHGIQADRHLPTHHRPCSGHFGMFGSPCCGWWAGIEVLGRFLSAGVVAYTMSTGPFAFLHHGEIP